MTNTQGIIDRYLKCLSLSLGGTIKEDNRLCSLKPGAAWGTGQAWKHSLVLVLVGSRGT